MIEQNPYPPSGEAVLFEFGLPNDISEDTASKEAMSIFANSGAGWWANVRAEKFSEVIEPRLMYVSSDLEHHVVWIKHSGLVETRSERLQNYTTYHVVCDCAVLKEEQGHPQTNASCDYVEDILVQRAAEMGRTTGLNEVLGNFTYFDEEDMEFRLSGLGEEVAIRAIATMLETDIKHPELWAANRLRGLHEIDIAGAFTHQGAHGVKPLLMMMERAGLIHINDNVFRLSSAEIVDM
jgi:hypothetical protein